MNKSNISIFFPVYNDERTVRIVTEKAIAFAEECAEKYEIIIINDNSPDRSGIIAEELTKENENIRVIHHPKNMGYGAAIKSGLMAAKYEIICFTDGDDEYDIMDFKRLLKLKDYYDLIITFRYRKIYSNKRIFISYIYNKLLRQLFRTNYRDISTGLRMIHKRILDDMNIISESPFIGAEITIKTMFNGYRVGEIGIQTFPREIGKGSSTSYKNILKTITDMKKVYKEIFSENYNLPSNRVR